VFGVILRFLGSQKRYNCYLPSAKREIQFDLPNLKSYSSPLP
jgi:hypothetical protein